MNALAQSIESGRISERVWFYSNYHCNLACTYCLTESSPAVPRRTLAPERMVEGAQEAAELGFRSIGVTGGEPFLLPEMPDLLAQLAAILPVVVLSNGTLFEGRRLSSLALLSGLAVKIQISLDRPEAVSNDAMRGPENFRKVIEAVPRLRRLGIGVRIASTLDKSHVEERDEEERARLCALHRVLGVADDDHVVRPVIRRGRAATNGIGEVVGWEELEPELTITGDGAFWSPFAPTVVAGRLDTDMLLVRTTRPLRVAAEAMLRVVEGRPARDDASSRFT